MLTDFKEFFAAGGGGFGVAEVETAEGIDDNFGDDEAGVFFVVGGDDIHQGAAAVLVAPRAAE